MFDRKAFFAALRRKDSGLFGTSLNQSQVEGIEGILGAFAEVGDGFRDTLAYALATAYWETGRRMIPVREGFAKTDAGARRAVEKLAAKRGPKSAVARYAKPAGPHGHVYYGRGHVQLTWLENYAASSADAGVDLVADPDAMLDPRISARVLIKGIMDGRWNGRGQGIRHYAEVDGDLDMDHDDLVAARRTVNVQDKAAEIAAYAKAFEAALIAAGMSDRIKRPLVLHRPAPRPVEAVTAPPGPTTAPDGKSGPNFGASTVLAALLTAAALALTQFWEGIRASLGF